MAMPNNPAGRLYDILSEALPSRSNKSIRETWANVFGIDPAATGDLLHLMAQLIELLRASRQRIEQVDGVDRDLYFQPIQNLEKAFASLNLDAQWNDFVNKVDNATMVGLAFCSDTLSQRHTEEVIQKEVLDDLLNDVETLVETVVASDLDMALKTVLTENLENIRRAILEYRIRGAEGLLRALEMSVGALLRHRDDFREKSDSDSVSGFWKFLGKLDRITGIAVKTKQLFGPAVAQLLGTDVDT
jgi:hypothetical protein